MARRFRRFASMFGLAGGAFIALSVQPAHAQCAAFSRNVGVALCHDKLTDLELGRLRGGFELAPGVKAFFAFSQIVKVNGETVQHIVVPQIEVSMSNPLAQLSVSGNANTKVQTNTVSIPLNGAGSGLQTAVLLASALKGGLTVVSGANGGQTLISTQFSGGGIANQVANTANNANISTATTISLATEGLLSSIQAQRAAGMVLNNLQRSQGISP